MIILTIKAIRPYLHLHLLEQGRYSSLNKRTMITMRVLLRCSHWKGRMRLFLWFSLWHRGLLILSRNLSSFDSILINNVWVSIADIFSLYLIVEGINQGIVGWNGRLMKWMYSKPKLNLIAAIQRYRSQIFMLDCTKFRHTKRIFPLACFLEDE